MQPEHLNYRFEDSEEPIDWTPLERLSLTIAKYTGTYYPDPYLQYSNYLWPGDFMYMGYYTCQNAPRIHAYKHSDTRRYLNLDPQGHAYRYLGNTENASHLAPYDNLFSALDHLELTLLENKKTYAAPIQSRL